MLLETSGSNLFWVMDSFENLMKATDRCPTKSEQNQHAVHTLESIMDTPSTSPLRITDPQCAPSAHNPLF